MEAYYSKQEDDYLSTNIDEIEEYDEIEEKENIISRFEKIVLFVNKENEIFSIVIEPKGINSPNITIYNHDNNKFKQKIKAVKLDNKKMDEIIIFLNDIKPIIYQQKNILEIGNNKMKVTKTIYKIIERIIGREYQELYLEKRKLQNEVNELCRKIQFERERDDNAENNPKSLVDKYKRLYDVTEKINQFNIDTIKK